MLVTRVMEKLAESWEGSRELSQVSECGCTVNVNDECLYFRSVALPLSDHGHDGCISVYLVQG